MDPTPFETRQPSPKFQDRVWLHLLLFVLTIASTTLVGAGQYAGFLDDFRGSAGLPMPFDTYHRNDQPDPIRAAADGQAPVVIAETDTGHVVLLAAAELEACKGSIDRLVEAIERSALSNGLTWPAP